MTEVTMVGLDLAKRIFQIHSATADGEGYDKNAACA